MQKRKSLRKSKVLLIRGPKFPWSGCKILSSRAKAVFSLNTEKNEKKKNCNRHNRKNKRFKKKSSKSCVEIEMKTFGDGLKNKPCYSNEADECESWNRKKTLRDAKNSLRIEKKGTNLHPSDSFTIYKQKIIKKKKSKLKKSIFSKFSNFLRKKNFKKKVRESIFSRFKRKRAGKSCDSEAIKKIEGKIQYLSELLESKVESQSNKFVKFSPEEIQIDSALDGCDGKCNSSILKNGKNVKKCVVMLEKAPSFNQEINYIYSASPKQPDIPPESIKNLLNKTQILENCIQEISNKNENPPKLPMLQNVLGYANQPPPEAPQLQRFEKYLKQNKTVSEIIPLSAQKPTKSLKEYFSTLKTSSLCKASRINFQLSDMKSNTSQKFTNFFKTKKNKTEKSVDGSTNEQEMKTYVINESQEEPFCVPNFHENDKNCINYIFNQAYQNVGKSYEYNKAKAYLSANNNKNLHFNNNIDNYNNQQPKNKNFSQAPKTCANNFSLQKYNLSSDLNSQNSKFQLISNHNNSKTCNATFSQKQPTYPKHAPSPVSVTEICENLNKLALSVKKKVCSKKPFNLRESPSVENLFKPQEIRKQFDVLGSKQFSNPKNYTASLNNYNTIKKLEKNFKLADDFCIKRFPLLTEDNVQESDNCNLSSRSCIKSKSKIDLHNVDACFHTPRQVAHETDQFLAEQLQWQQIKINALQKKKISSRRPISSISRSRITNRSLSKNNSLSRRNSNLNSENILERKNSFAWCTEATKKSNIKKKDMHLVLTEKLDENGKTTSSQVFHCYDRLNKQQNNCPSQETLNNRSYKISASANNKVLNRRVSVNSVAKSIKQQPVLPGRGRGTRNHFANKKLKKSPTNRRPGLVIKRQNSSRMFCKNVLKRSISKEPDYLKTLTHWRNSKLATDESIILKESNFQKRHLENIFKKNAQSKNFNVVPNSSYSNFTNFSAKNEKGDTDLNQAVEVNSFTLFLEDYKLLGRISRGSFGQVLLAHNNKLNFTCALRMVPKDLIIGDSDKIKVDTEFTNSYVPDVINKCPFFVHLLDIFQTENFFFFAMEFIDYCNLELILAFQGSFEYTQVKFYSAGIILALKYIHELDIIHRNVKLNNVLIDSKGYPRVTDFGRCDFGPIVKEVLEKKKKSETTDFNSLTGIQYVAPEVFTMPSYDRMVDFWSLGVCIQYMLTGNLKKNWEEVIDYNNQLDDKYNQSVVKLLKSINVENPYSRLGMGQIGVDDIMKHSFYEVIDWDKYSEKHYYVPVPDPLCKTRHVSINNEIFQDLSESLIAMKHPNHGEGFLTPNPFPSSEHCLANKITFVSPKKPFQNSSTPNHQILQPIIFPDKSPINLVPNDATTPQFPSQNIPQQNLFPIYSPKQNNQFPCQILSSPFTRTPINQNQTLTPQLCGIYATKSPLFRESPFALQNISEQTQQPQIIYKKNVLTPIQQVNVQQTLQKPKSGTAEKENKEFFKQSSVLQNFANVSMPEKQSIQFLQNLKPTPFNLLTENKKAESIKQNIKEKELRMILKQQEMYRNHQEQMQKLDQLQMQQELTLRHQMLCNQKHNQDYSSGENTPSVNSIIFSKKKKKIKRIKRKRLRKKVNSVPLSPYTAPASPRSPYSPPLTSRPQNAIQTPNSSLGFHSKEEDFLMRLAELKYMYGSRHDFNINLPPISSVKRAIMVNKDNAQITIDPKIRKYFDYYQQKILPQPKFEIPSNEDLKETKLDLSLPDFANKNVKSLPETPVKKTQCTKNSILKAAARKKETRNKMVRPILKKQTKFHQTSSSSTSSSSSESSK